MSYPGWQVFLAFFELYDLVFCEKRLLMIGFVELAMINWMNMGLI